MIKSAILPLDYKKYPSLQRLTWKVCLLGLLLTSHFSSRKKVIFFIWRTRPQCQIFMNLQCNNPKGRAVQWKSLHHPQPAIRSQGSLFLEFLQNHFQLRAVLLLPSFPFLSLLMVLRYRRKHPLFLFMLCLDSKRFWIFSFFWGKSLLKASRQQLRSQSWFPLVLY